MAEKVVKTAILLLILAVLYSFSGCSENMHTFEKDGMSITLSDDFKEKQSNNTACYESSNAVVLVKKEGFAAMSDAGLSPDISAAEYSELVAKSNGLDVSVTEENEIVYFEYNMDTDFGNFKYFACVYKGSDAFWLIQFSCSADIYDDVKDEFFTFAQSVKV